MRQGKYLNVILTVNAVLLGALVWTQVSGTPVFARSASAQSRSVPYQRVPNSALNGVPNAGKQRDAIMRAVKELNKTTQELKQLMESGNVRVQVSNLDEIKIEVGG